MATTAACGRLPGTKPEPLPSVSPVPPGSPGAPSNPGAPLPSLGPLPDGQALLKAVRAKVANTPGVDVEVKAASSGHYYGGKKVAELRSSSSRSRMLWGAPGKLRAQVLESTTPLLAGSTLVMLSPDQLKVKAGGALGLIPISMKSSDTRLMTNRNHYFTDNHPVAHLKRLTAEGASWKGVAPLPVAPSAAWVEISGVRRLDKDLTRELLALDPKTLQPKAMAMMEGDKSVVTFQFLKFLWDAVPNPNAFKL
ncbi:MAG: hypothetical protein VKP62_15575 [Candidatus Sericytochromatia bacterium]|nr:hypothetical protein [Candidatus Sericytochromatia bacterium]